MNTNYIKVGIVDDDSLFVQLLTSYISQNKTIKVVNTWSGGHDFFKDMRVVDLDILILDLKMADGNGMDVLERLKQHEQEIKTIVLSSYYRKSFTGQMLQLGVHAFFPKDIEPEVLLNAVETVFHQGHYFSEDQISVLRNQLSNKLPKFHESSKDSLTSREIDVLKLLCQQLSTKEIAEKLFVSPRTIETHKSNLLIKTGVKNTAGLVIYAIQNNVVDTNDFIL